MSAQETEDLLREKNLFDVYYLSRRVPRNNLYSIVESVAAVAIAFWALRSEMDAATLAATAREWSLQGFGFATSILGFLVAGFAIFTGMIRMELAVVMAKKTHPPSGLSYLKYNFVAFVRVFAEYSAFVALYLVMLIFFSPSGLGCEILRALPNADSVRFLVGVAAVTLVGWLLVRLVIGLQAFVFNTYHIVMTIIAAEVVEKEGGPIVGK